MFEGFEAKRIVTSGAEIALRIGGEGPPLLLLHGYPQTHVMWHAVVPRLADRFTLVCTDLRGYGASSKPPSDETHAAYSKRAMAQDMVEVMAALGFQRFSLAGHDRGARVTHRLCLDHPTAVDKACVIDICPTVHMYEPTNFAFAKAYYHWFMLIQPYDLPERLIGGDPHGYMMTCLASWGGGGFYDEAAIAAYSEAFCKPETIHATCEDYRAAASIDMEHDRAAPDAMVEAPLLVLWGERSIVARHFDPIAAWREKARDVRGNALPGGHFLPDENPEAVATALRDFFI